MLNGHSVEFSPEGYFLIYKNIDKPGAPARGALAARWSASPLPAAAACVAAAVCLPVTRMGHGSWVITSRTQRSEAAAEPASHLRTARARRTTTAATDMDAGVLASVASCMAGNGVNIGTAIVSTCDTDGVVTSVMSLDKKLDKSILIKAKALPDVAEVHLVFL